MIWIQLNCHCYRIYVPQYRQIGSLAVACHVAVNGNFNFEIQFEKLVFHNKSKEFGGLTRQGEKVR